MRVLYARAGGHVCACVRACDSASAFNVRNVLYTNVEIFHSVDLLEVVCERFHVDVHLMESGSWELQVSGVS